jgi:type VI secretion system protein ImpM
MSNKTPNISAGYFGKVPIRGDFVSRYLPLDFIEPWDDWLKGTMMHTQQQLGEKWLDHYLISPIWRFALSAGICGKDPWNGILMPSVDAVGRYFPFTIAISMPANDNPMQSMMEGDDWYARAEAAARSCLEDDFSFDVLERALHELGRLPEEEKNSTLGCLEDERFNDAWALNIPSLNALSKGYPELIRQLLTELFFAYSLWWTQGSKHVKPVFLICQGLPPFEGFSAMLDGKWTERGWQSRQIVEID